MTDAMTRHSDEEVLAAFVDGQLDREQLEAVATHLAECEECRGVIRQLDDNPNISPNILG